MIDVEKLVIQQGEKGSNTLTRTIRISGSSYDEITKLAEKNHITFNNVVNQLIEYALNNVEDKQ